MKALYESNALNESVDEFGLDPTSYESYDDYLRDKAELMVNDMFEDLDYEQKQELINGLLDQDEDEWEDWCMNMYADYGATNMMENRNESVKNYFGRRRLITEGKALTSEEKMDRWHNGSRKENIKACSDEKLKEYRKICRAKGYAEEVKQINAELRARKSVSESFVFEAKSDNGGLRNSVLYGFLLRKVAPIVAATVTEAGFAAKVHDSSAAKDKVADVKVDIKGRGINGINKLNINYYNPGEPVMGVSNSKFASGSIKTDPTFGLAFVSEEKVYIIPKPTLQRNWGKLMSTDRSIQMVKDALGMRSEITICDASKMMELAESEGYVYTMSAANAAKYRTELNKYLGVDDANIENAPVTESEFFNDFGILDEATNDNFTVDTAYYDKVKRLAITVPSFIKRFFDKLAPESQAVAPKILLGKDSTTQYAITGLNCSLTDRQTLAASILTSLKRNGIPTAFIKKWAEYAEGRGPDILQI